MVIVDTERLISRQTYPFDSVKTEYQRKCLERNTAVKYPKIAWFNRKSYRGKLPPPVDIHTVCANMDTLPIGFGLAMARSCLTNIVFFSSFEFIKKKINQLPDPVLLDSVD